MSRYIDAEILSDALRHLTLGETDAARATMKITHYVSRMPTVDAVEVVRCKDCKHHYSWKDVDDCFYHACDRWGDNLGYDADVDVNYFCSFGERADT